MIAYPDIREANRRLAALRAELTMFEVQALRNQPDYYPLWERYSVGGMTSEDYWGAVLVGLGFQATPERVDALIDILSATAWANLDQTVLAMAQDLRAHGLRLGLLSNSAAYHDAAIETFAGAFDIAHFSHRIGLRKPMPAAYLGAARALGLPPEAIVFIDDKRRNTAAAEQLGMRALHFQDAEALGSALAALGLVDPA